MKRMGKRSGGKGSMKKGSGKGAVITTMENPMVKGRKSMRKRSR